MDMYTPLYLKWISNKDLLVRSYLLVQHRELCSMLCGNLDARGVWGRMDTCICLADSICRSPEAITTLLTGCTLIQNKKLKKILQSLMFPNS